MIASRLFRGPKAIPVTEFRIAPLDRNRCVELVRRANLEPEARRELVAWIDGSLEALRELSKRGASSQRAMTSNPMFVGLLCAQAKAGSPIPDDSHSIYDTYVSRLFERDRVRLLERFGLDPERLRSFAEAAAFHMSTGSRGLEPELPALCMQLAEHEGIEPARAELQLRALAYMKLATIRGNTEQDNPTFTFAHRRFQEFFATCVLLAEPDRVDARTLLTDASWREATVVLLQTRTGEELEPLLESVKLLLGESLATLDETKADDDNTQRYGFDWPIYARHLCGIIQDGLRGQRERLGAVNRDLADRLLDRARSKGTLLDAKWALEVAGAQSDAGVLQSLREAFESGSVLLADAAFWQLHDLAETPEDIADRVNERLLAWAKSGLLRRERHVIAAYIARAPDPKQWAPILGLLVHMRSIMLGLNAVLLLLALLAVGPTILWLMAVVGTLVSAGTQWRPMLTVVSRLVVLGIWVELFEQAPHADLWLVAAFIVLSWDLFAWLALELNFADWRLFRWLPWLVLPTFGLFVVWGIELRGVGKGLLKVGVALLGIAAVLGGFIVLAFGLDWIDDIASTHTPRLYYVLGWTLWGLVYLVGGIVGLVVLVFACGGIVDSIRDRVRFLRAHKLVRGGGLSSFDVLRALLAEEDDTERRIRLVDLARKYVALPSDTETLQAARALERSGLEEDEPIELLDAYARLSESLIERHVGVDTS